MVRRAVSIVGSQARLGRALGVSQARICQLTKSVQRCSAEIAVGMDRVTEGRVPAWETRPDLFAAPAASGNGSLDSAAVRSMDRQ